MKKDATLKMRLISTRVSILALSTAVGFADSYAIKLLNGFSVIAILR